MRRFLGFPRLSNSHAAFLIGSARTDDGLFGFFAVYSCGLAEFRVVQKCEMPFVTDVATLRRPIGGAAATLELAPASEALNVQRSHGHHRRGRDS